MGQKLVRLLGSGIKAHRIIHLVIGGIGHLLIAAVYGRAGGVDQMFNTLCALIIGMTAGLKDIVKSDEIGLYVNIGMVYGIAHTGLCGKVDDDIGLVFSKSRIGHSLVCHIAANKAESAACAFTPGSQLFKHVQSVFLEGNFIIIVHAVNTDNMNILILLKQLGREKCTNETGRTGDKDGLVFFAKS